MAINDLGVSFLDSNGDRSRRRPGADSGRISDAVQILALQLPRILGSQSIAPSELLAGSADVPRSGLSPTSAVGPQTSSLAQAIASSVLNSITRPGTPVTTDLTGLSVQPNVRPPAPTTDIPTIPIRDPRGPNRLPPIQPTPEEPAPPFEVPRPPGEDRPRPAPAPEPPPVRTPEPAPAPEVGPPPGPVISFPAPGGPGPTVEEPAPGGGLSPADVEALLERVRGYKNFLFEGF